MLKRALILVLLFAVGLTWISGCSDAGVSKSDGKLEIVTTIFPAYDFARQIFGDTAEVTLLLKPGMESHSYDPSARDIVRIAHSFYASSRVPSGKRWLMAPCAARAQLRTHLRGNSSTAHVLPFMDQSG